MQDQEFDSIEAIEERIRELMYQSAIMAERLENAAEMMRKAPLYTQTIRKEGAETVRIIAPKFSQGDIIAFLKMAMALREASILSPAERYKLNGRDDQLVKEITKDLLCMLQKTLPSDVFAQVIAAMNGGDVESRLRALLEKAKAIAKAEQDALDPV